MKLGNLQPPFTHTCAAILCLAALAQAETQPDRQQTHADESAPSTLDSEPGDAEQAPLPSTAEPGRPPGPPGAPPGAPPGGGPPPMAVGQLHVGVLTRVDIGLSGLQLDDPFSTALSGLGVVAKVHENFTITTNLTGTYDARDASGAVSLLDAIVQFEPTPALNVWLGRMVEAVDRSGLSGPWFMAPWYFTGVGYADGQVPLPKAGFLGRSNGATVWGSVLGGHLKYYASVFDLVAPGESPLLTGRINLSLLDPEPGYYNSSSYFGKDILSLGVGAQAKKNGSVNPITQDKSDYSEFNADLLFEKNLGAAGVIDVEAAYYKFTGDFERTSSSWFGLASYVLPGQIAGARLQPLVRVQRAMPPSGGPASTLIDGQLSLLLNGFFARLAVGYRRAIVGSLEVPSVFLGLQFMQL